MPEMRVTVGAGVAWVYSVLATLVPAGVVASAFAFRSVSRTHVVEAPYFGLCSILLTRHSPSKAQCRGHGQGSRRIIPIRCEPVHIRCSPRMPPLVAGVGPALASCNGENMRKPHIVGGIDAPFRRSNTLPMRQDHAPTDRAD